MTQRRPRHLRPNRNGTRVLIVQDCRIGGTATGLEGVIESKVAFHGDGIQRRSRCTFAIPRIRLDDGGKIDGCECWWIPVREATAAVVACARGER